jgi:hypothetical protein
MFQWWFVNFVAKFFKVFGDGGYDFIFGIVIYCLQFVKEKCLQFGSGGAFNIKGGDEFREGTQIMKTYISMVFYF